MAIALTTRPVSAQEFKLHTTINAGEQVVSIAFSPDGKLLATGDANLTVKLWNVATGKEKATLIKATMPKVLKEGNSTVSRDTEGFSSLAFSPDGELLAAVSNKAMLRVWEVASGKERAACRPHNAGVSGVAFSPDGKLLVTGGQVNVIKPGQLLGWDGEVKLWDTATFKEKATLKPSQTTYVLCVAFSADGKLLAAGIQKDDLESVVVKLWDVATLKERAPLEGKGQYEIVNSVAFSKDGKLLAAGSNSATGNGAVRLWDVGTGKERNVFKGHIRPVSSVAFSPDDKLLASSDHLDEMVRLWDVASGKQEATIKTYEVGVSSVAFSPDGKLLAAAEFKTVGLYEVPGPKPAGK